MADNRSARFRLSADPRSLIMHRRGIMQTIITGKAFVLGDNVDTDQIIPAHYLSFNPSIPEERKFFGMYANSGVPEAQAGLPKGNIRFVPEGQFKSEYSIIIGGEKFCRGKPRRAPPPGAGGAGGGKGVAGGFCPAF